MNNQAAQTMPEPDAYCAPYEPNNAVAFAWPGTDRAPMHIAPLYCQQKVVDAYQQGYAAALSQTAGGADGWKLVPAKPTEAMLSAMDMCLMAGPADAYRAMLAAAPAASGGEDDEAPEPTAMQIRYAEGYSDGVRDTERIAKERESSVASVSERAREFLAKVLDGYDCPIEPENINIEGVIRTDIVLAALEQALTQQRGEREDAHKFRRLAQLLDGFDFRLGRNALMPPATYLDSVEITCEFQPGIGQSVIDAIVDVLTTEKRND